METASIHSVTLAPFATATQNTESSSHKRQVSNHHRATSIRSPHSSSNSSSRRRTTSSLSSPSENRASPNLCPSSAPNSIPAPLPSLSSPSLFFFFFAALPSALLFRIGMLVVSMRCSESVHWKMECQVCFAAWFPALPVHAAFPPSFGSSCVRLHDFIFSFAYLRHTWIYDLTGFLIAT